MVRCSHSSLSLPRHGTMAGACGKVNEVFDFAWRLLRIGGAVKLQIARTPGGFAAVHNDCRARREGGDRAI
jgi:hypothetical protein